VTAPSRATEIRPPSVRVETLNVLKAGAAIVLVVAAYLFRPSLGGQSQSTNQPIGLLPYQRLIRDASAPEQRIFRELQEGLLEAEAIRAATGHWPDVSTLSDEGVPPFAPDPTQKTSYKWTSVRQDWVTNYLGVPSDPSAPAWVLVILEPEPGAPPDPAPNDETHHRLPDGTTLHVSVWNLAETKRRSGLAALRLPQNEGWTNLLVGQNVQ
jgi:hypothetical protein